MKRVHAGVTIDLPPNVWLLDLDDRRPVFHAGSSDTRELGAGSWELATICGLWTYGHVAAEGADSARGHWIPTRHARRFARPCVRCWPDLGTRTLELLEGPLPGGTPC